MMYKSERIYQLWAYSPSHSFLILRSTRLLEGDDSYSLSRSFTIDIEFSGVGYLDIPTAFRTIMIVQSDENIPDKLVDLSTNYGYKIYTLKCDGGTYYIAAAGIIVGKSHWRDTDRIKNPYLEYEEVLLKL